MKHLILNFKKYAWTSALSWKPASITAVAISAVLLILLPCIAYSQTARELQASLAQIPGLADFHLPVLSNLDMPEEKRPFKYSTEKIGSLAIVIYSHVDKPVGKQDILNALAKGGDFHM